MPVSKLNDFYLVGHGQGVTYKLRLRSYENKYCFILGRIPKLISRFNIFLLFTIKIMERMWRFDRLRSCAYISVRTGIYVRGNLYFVDNTSFI